MKVTIGIITYRRPVGLRRLLDSVATLRPPAPDLNVGLVVVDNDRTESARAVCETFRRFSLVYAVEPMQSIPRARNRVVALALDCDLLVFIDDDQELTPDWLNTMVETHRRSGADIVAGSVIPRFEAGTPAWIAESTLFHFATSTSGQPVRCVATCGLLISRHAISRLAPLFDERLRLTGGEDTLLSMRARKQGLAIEWSNLAISYEHVPNSRANVRWLAKRAFRTGSSRVVAERLAGCGTRTLLIRLIKTVLHIVLGILLLAFGWPGGRESVTRAVMRVIQGVGMIAGFAGFVYQEYRHVHGT